MQLRSDLVPAVLAFLVGAATAFVLGLVWRERPWRWVVWLMVGLGQYGIPNLLPLGLVAFALLGIPYLVAAYAGRWLGETTFARQR